LLVDNSVSTLKIDPLTHAVTVQPGGGGSAVPISLSGGSLSGILQTRDVTLPAFRSQLDDIAASLTQGVAAAGVALFNDGGSVPYAAANKTGFADRIAVDSAITANPALVRDSSGLTPSGDTTAIANVLGFFDSTATTFAAPGLPAQGKIGDVAGALVANYSTMRANLQSQRDQQTAVKESIDQRLANEDGVNVDQELTQLIQLQNSYAANAKVLETVNQLYQQLISMV
jgi:flagellar hook-associated protein 1 FlgK